MSAFIKVLLIRTGNTLRIGVKYTLPPLQGKEAVASAIKRANYELFLI